MQVTKLKNVDSLMCDRFTSFWIDTMVPRIHFAKLCGLSKNYSCISEIKNYVTEPSKKMIVALAHSIGASPTFILLGIGDRYLPQDLSKRVPFPGFRKTDSSVHRHYAESHL